MSTTLTESHASEVTAQLAEELGKRFTHSCHCVLGWDKFCIVFVVELDLAFFPAYTLPNPEGKYPAKVFRNSGCSFFRLSPVAPPSASEIKDQKQRDICPTPAELREIMYDVPDRATILDAINRRDKDLYICLAVAHATLQSDQLTEQLRAFVEGNSLLVQLLWEFGWECSLKTNCL
jgi:hypothetical protein